MDRKEDGSLGAYHAVDETAIEGQVLDSGKDPIDELLNVNGAVRASWGTVYLPEEYVGAGSPLVTWLTERCAVSAAKTRLYQSDL